MTVVFVERMALDLQLLKSETNIEVVSRQRVRVDSFMAFTGPERQNGHSIVARTEVGEQTSSSRELLHT